jgi:hypothetical protein
MLRYALRVLVGLAVGGGLAGAACSINRGGNGEVPDASASDAAADGAAEAAVAPEAAADATGDGPEAGGDGASACNAQNCGGACCGDTCVPRTCATCAMKPTFCPFTAGASSVNGYCVPDCSTCSAGAVTCFSCALGVPVELCATALAQCPSDPTSGACSCSSGDAGECPGRTQVCATLGDGGMDAARACLGCGQQGTDGLACVNGRACAQPGATCK